MPFATYFAPATIRVWAHAPDPAATSTAALSPQVDFYLGTQRVGSAPAMDGKADYYQLDIPNVAAGTYELSAKSLLQSGTVESSTCRSWWSIRRRAVASPRRWR